MEPGRGYRPAALNAIQQRALRITKGTATYEDRFVPNHSELVQIIEDFRSRGCVIAFVTGVWDLFHIGHGNYLQKGKDETAKLYPQAEHIILVVGVDTDAFTKSRKGPDRPIVPEDERCRVLGHLRPVDIITLQYEADQLFKVVAHDVRIISESTKDLPNLEKIQEQCAHIVNLPPQAETSTTARIRRLTFDGATGVLLKVKAALAAALEEVSNEIERQ
ncbi:adenylyltransferase/cytidyltransferase family protein [Patescibacteria group bacterium]|nr:adenylyltransferase/cytidyltransferase family protein [Patescibacteria group bacterium]